MKRTSKWVIGVTTAALLVGGTTTTVLSHVSAESSAVTVLKDESASTSAWTKSGQNVLGSLTMEQVSERQVEFVIKGILGPDDKGSVRGVARIIPGTNKAVFHNTVSKTTTTLILGKKRVTVVTKGLDEEYASRKEQKEYLSKPIPPMPLTFDGVYHFEDK